MPWLALLTNRLTYIIAAFALCCAALAVQTTRLKWVQAEYATFQASTAKEAADAKVRAAQEAARHAQNAQEVLDDLQTRNAALSARYERLRQSAADSHSVPPLSSAAPVLSACHSDAGKPDPNIGRLDALEEEILGIAAKADRELAKYAALWKLQQENAAKQ